MLRRISVLFVLVPFVLLLFTNFKQDFSKDDYDNLKDQVELISWIFSGIMAIISFFAIFIGFMYENKLISASKDLQNIYRPYTINISEYRQVIINYQVSMTSNNLISYLYWVYLIVSSCTIYVWGVAVGFYTKYQVSLEINFSVPAVLNFGIYLFFLILSGLLVSLTFILNQIKHFKDPLGKGYLPNTDQITDIDYLKTKNSDLDEVLIKSGFHLEFYKNPPISNPKYEMILNMPVKLKNLRFVLKIYDKEKNNILKCYGKILDNSNFGERFLYRITDNLPNSIFNTLQDNASGELKVYDSDDSVISRITLRLDLIDEYNHTFILQKAIKEREIMENDSRF